MKTTGTGTHAAAQYLDGKMVKLLTVTGGNLVSTVLAEAGTEEAPVRLVRVSQFAQVRGLLKAMSLEVRFVKLADLPK